MKSVKKLHDIEPGQRPLAIIKRTAHLRADRDTGEEFVKVSLADLENQWNGMIEFSRGRHNRMSADAGRYCEEVVKRVLKVTPSVRFEAGGNQSATSSGRRVHNETKNRRVDFVCDGGKRFCAGGIEHVDLDADAVASAIVESMKVIGQTTDPEEAHAEFWAANALASVLANHGIECQPREMWFTANPMHRKSVTKAEYERLREWDSRWISDIDPGQVSDSELFEARYDDYSRFMVCERGGDPRQVRSKEPPADWQPAVGE